MDNLPGNYSCRLCRQPFSLTKEDVALIQALAPKIGAYTFNLPLPTKCPDCRLQEKMAFNNGLELYRRKDSITGRALISIYPPHTNFPVISYNSWVAEDFSPMQPHRAEDPSTDFLKSWLELRNRIPRPSQVIINCESCDYCSVISNSKNCYLMCGMAAEDCMYGLYSAYIYRCLDFYFAVESRFCYECIYIRNCERLFFSQDCEHCSDSDFLFDCKSCRDCFCCVNLRQKQFCVFNKQLTAAAYRDFMTRVDMSSYTELEKWKKKFQEFKILKPHRAAFISRCEDSTGDHITALKRCHYCFGADSLAGLIEDCHYTSIFGNSTDHCFDVYGTGEGTSYAYCSGFDAWTGRGFYFCSGTHHSSNVFFCDLCSYLEDCFGCVGLKHKKYCILNVQYSKSEYETLTKKIIEELKARGEWGEFFPPGYSAYSYNNSMAQLDFPLDAPRATAIGYKWYEIAPVSPQVNESVKAQDLPDNVRAVDNSFLDRVITCQTSGRPFRLIRKELDFYREFNLALPRIHPTQREYARALRRNPYRLWERTCSECGTRISTSYAPERTERVLCSACYEEVVLR